MAQEGARLGDGVGPLRWSDTPTLLLAKYPDAAAIPVRHARHPLTGRAIVRDGGYRLTGLIGVDDVWRVTFDGERMSSLEWWGKADGNNWRAVEHAVESMIRTLAARYDLGPVSDLHTVEDTSWVTDGVRIDFRIEGDLYLIHIAPVEAFETAASA